MKWKLSFAGLALSSVFGLGFAENPQGDAWQPLPDKKTEGKERLPSMSRSERAAYRDAIRKTAQMVSDAEAQDLARRHGLNVLNVTWEDTGRYKGSAVGPNISDMTIQVALEDERTKRLDVTCMPVIRFPNFSDVSCDLDPSDFTLMVGNEKGRRLQRVSLREFLESPTRFLSKPGSWRSSTRSLLAPRDSKVLVSAQACFLPVPQQGLATFNPVLFNYQSVSGDPAVLTILATREGTSVTVIDNKRDAFSVGGVWGQRLFHNLKGMRASFTGQRLTDFKIQQGENPAPSSKDKGLSMVLLIQVPLKQKERARFADSTVYAPAMAGGGYGGANAKAREGSDVEAAVIGHGETEGPFTEIDNLDIRRDERYPVRVTVQFYKATSNGVVSERDMLEIKQQIDSVYKLSDSVGSLVTEGETGRATEYWGSKVQPRDWWQRFWERHERNTGDNREIAIAKLRMLLGKNYMERPVCELYLRDVLRDSTIKR